MPLVIGVGVLALLLLALFARDQMRDVRRDIFAAPNDYSQRLFWLVVVFCLLLLVGFVSLMAGGVLMLDGNEDAGRVLLLLGLCLSLFGYVGEISWFMIRQRITSHQKARAEFQEARLRQARQKFLNVLQARMLTLRSRQ